MFTLTMHCTYCCFDGVIELPGIALDVPPAACFKRIGRNPYSGHLHYQCPACGIVHLVDPADIPDEDFVLAVYGQPDAGTNPSSVFAGIEYRA